MEVIFMTVVSMDCPHCGKNLISRSNRLPYKVGNPVKNCPHCNGEYIMPKTIEWGIAGLLHKFYYTFISTIGYIPALFLSMEFGNTTWSSAIIFLIVWITYSIIRLKIFDSDKITESYQRTKDNPEYIQKLSDMGYLYIDFRIDPYYK